NWEHLFIHFKRVIPRSHPPTPFKGGPNYLVLDILWDMIRRPLVPFLIGLIVRTIYFFRAQAFPGEAQADACARLFSIISPSFISIISASSFILIPNNEQRTTNNE
ncbi:MAG: hypothetical protein ACO1NZ_16040, partial [Adhaeribacter sp.]